MSHTHRRWLPANYRYLGLVRRQVLLRDGLTCQLCGWKPEEPGRQLKLSDKKCQEKHLTLDHVVPVSRGGRLALSNLRTACNDCNWRRGAEDQRRVLGALGEGG